MDFQRYNIREKQKEKGRKKKKKKERKRIIKKQTNKQTIKKNKQKKPINNHPKTVYGVCLKKKKVFLKNKQKNIVIIGYRNKN